VGVNNHFRATKLPADIHVSKLVVGKENVGYADKLEGGWPRTGLYLGFEVLTLVVMKSSIYLDLMLCNPLKVN
jgi:hypothetical protein